MQSIPGAIVTFHRDLLSEPKIFEIRSRDDASVLLSITCRHGFELGTNNGRRTGVLNRGNCVQMGDNGRSLGGRFGGFSVSWVAERRIVLWIQS